MAARVTEVEVQEIIEVDSSLSLTAFIAAATALVDDKLDQNIGLGDDLLKEIERWLAAHFVAIRIKITSQEKLGDAAENYQFKLGLNLQNTMWGQQALMLDTSGTLNRLSQGKGSVTKIQTIDITC